jgi:hypothetical protein
MAKNSYRVLWPQMGEGNKVLETRVVVLNRNEQLVSVRLPREASWDQMKCLAKSVTNDKEPAEIRKLVNDFANRLSTEKGKPC